MLQYHTWFGKLPTIRTAFCYVLRHRFHGDTNGLINRKS